jgi:hypothetical protein
MNPHPMVLYAVLALAPACGDARTDRNPEAAGIEDTTPAPSTDVGIPTTDTAADTGGVDTGPR